jgi:hypothetical protein
MTLGHSTQLCQWRVEPPTGTAKRTLFFHRPLSHSDRNGMRLPCEPPWQNTRLTAADCAFARPCCDDIPETTPGHGTETASSLVRADSRFCRRIGPRRQPLRQIRHDYDIRGVLGRGTMAEVRTATHPQSTNGTARGSQDPFIDAPTWALESMYGNRT